MSNTAQRGQAGPRSPCISVCALDADGLCSGCLRTCAEIGRWLAMSPLEQWQLLDELERRRARRHEARDA